MPVKVARLVNYATKYEIILTNGPQTYLVSYTGRKSRQGLMDAIRARGLAILAITKIGADAIFTLNRATGAAELGSNWTIRFTGRTQRDAICQRDEYRYVGTVADEIGGIDSLTATQ
jgi:hypothetical protein